MAASRLQMRSSGYELLVVAAIASPYAHIPKLPGAEFTLTPMVTLTILAALLTAAGLTGLRRRDIG